MITTQTKKSTSKKLYRFAPLAFAVASLMTSVTAQTEVPSTGDLSIYSSSSNADKNPTIMLVLEASTATNLADGVPQQTLDSEIIDIAGWSDTVPRYKRFGYYMSLSNAGGNNEDELFPSRLTRMKDAMFYLMDTPGLLPDNYRIGLTRYSGGTVVKDNPSANGDGHTANVVLGAKELGPIIEDYDFEKNSSGNFVKNESDNSYVQVQYQHYENVGNSNTFYPIGTGGWVKKVGIYYKLINNEYVPNAEGNYVFDESLSTTDKIRSVTKEKDFIKLTNPDDSSNYETDDNGWRLTTYERVCSGSDANGNRVEDSHRCAIKQYVAAICDADVLCTGSAPMAVAYTEAGAYMMGTKTSKLVNKPNTFNEDQLAYPRVLRRKDGNWQYCPPEYRQVFEYADASAFEGKRYRSECPETVIVKDSNGNDVEVSAWKNVNKDNVANWYWAGGNNEASDNELSEIENKRKYDLLWYNAAPKGPYGSRIASVNRLGAYDLSIKKYDFSEDSFQDRKKTQDGTVETDGYEYWVDDNANPESGLYPEQLHRTFRRAWGSGYYSRAKWQYCDIDKAKLINYNVADYRLTCDDSDWVDVSRGSDNNATLPNGDTLSVLGRRSDNLDKIVKWNTPGFSNKPSGVNSILNPNLTSSDHYFVPDRISDPYDGWEYFYNANRYSEIPMPPTLLGVAGYRASSIRNSPPDVREPQSYTYKKPSYSKCSGTSQYDSSGNVVGQGPQTVENAILFITAGKPFMDATYSAPTSEMNMSLTKSSNPSTVDPMGGGITCPGTSADLSSAYRDGNLQNNFWCVMGEYSKRLRKADNYDNPAGVPIKTGTFVFTKPSISSNLEVGATIEDGVKKYNCENAGDLSIENACKLGQYGEGFGEGGFFISKSTNPQESYLELANSIVTMAENLSDDTGLIPTSMPIVPTNAIKPSTMLPNGYMPLIQPKPGTSSAHWSGNLRKYKQTDKGFEDSRSKSPFGSAANIILSTYSKDLWAKNADRYESSEQEGGAYSQIPMPTSDTSDTPRNVYISSSATGELTRYTPSNIDDVSITGIDSTKQDTVRRLLLNYMGYTISDYVKGTTPVEDVTATYSSGDNKSLGGVYHSTPIALMPEAAREGTSKNYSKYKTFIMFGAMDNALHIVDDSTGVEVLSYFPQEVLANNGQYKAIVPELSAAEGEAKPSFGVDAPWTSYASYGFKGEDSNDESALVAKELFAFGGARLGAKAYYGIDLTGLEKVSSDASNSSTSLGEFNPKQLFTITDSTTGFERLGYTWAKPVITHINWNGERTLVAILSGGYDASEYDKSDAERQAEHEAADAAPTTLGNAIYIVDAKSGELLIKASNGTKTSNATGFESSNADGDAISVSLPNLKHSVPGSVKVLDRDADELADHLYFADLDGQLFRMDIDNIAAINTNISKARLVRLADLNTDSSDKIPGPRFYETPAVTIQEKDGYRFATVSVASGDRSNPLRVSNPDAETSSISVKFQSTGGEVTLKASKVDGSWVKESGFPAGDSITLNSETGQIVIKPQAFKSDTKVEATTGFVTTYTATSELNASSSSESSNKDPLAPKISLATGSLTVTLATSVDVTSKPSYVYTVYDKDVTSVNLYSTNTAKLKTQDIEVTINDIEDKFPDVSDSANEEISGYDKSGWRMPLLRFGSNATGSNFYQSDNKSIKAIGPISAIANTLYVSAYNPNDGNIDTTGCTAEVVGSTEVYQLCLPYGICDSEYVEQYQRISYGKGILPLSWATDTSGSKRKFFGQNDYVTSTNASGDETNQQNTQSPLNNDTLDGAPFVQSVYGFKGVLKPQEWFDYSIKLPE